MKRERFCFMKTGIGTRSSARIPGPDSASQRSASIVGTSSIEYASARGLPCSRVRSVASSSSWSMIAWPARSM